MTDMKTATGDELVDEVQRRMDRVVEAAVEWHQAGREGGEWFEAAEKLGAAIDSLLELRDKPSVTTECFCGTELEAGLCPNGHDPVSQHVAAARGSERRRNHDERYRYGWCCDYDFENGSYRTTSECIGRTRNADVVERLARTTPAAG